MIVVSIIYPATAESKFNIEYYQHKHLPLVAERWGTCGLTAATFLQGIGTPDGGSAAYHMIALLTFDSPESFQEAAQRHGKQIMSDIKNFTNVRPAVQLNTQFG